MFLMFFEKKKKIEFSKIDPPLSSSGLHEIKSTLMKRHPFLMKESYI